MLDDTIDHPRQQVGDFANVDLELDLPAEGAAARDQDRVGLRHDRTSGRRGSKSGDGIGLRTGGWRSSMSALYREDVHDNVGKTVRPR
jgi:hypothetical protein